MSSCLRVLVLLCCLQLTLSVAVDTSPGTSAVVTSAGSTEAPATTDAPASTNSQPSVEPTAAATTSNVPPVTSNTTAATTKSTAPPTASTTPATTPIPSPTPTASEPPECSIWECENHPGRYNCKNCHTTCAGVPCHDSTVIGTDECEKLKGLYGCAPILVYCPKTCGECEPCT